MLRQVCSTVCMTLCLAALALGCSPKPTVGVLLPTTGEASTYGVSIESGVRLAFNQARELDALPVGFQVIWADTQSDTETAISEMRRIAKDNRVRLFISGATSAEAKALLPVLDELQVVCLSPSASAPSLTKESKLFFRIFPSDELEGNAAAKFLHDRMKKQRVLIYASDSEYTRGIEPAFTTQFKDNLGGEIAGRVDFKADGWEDRSAELLGSGQVDAVYVIGYAEGILTVLEHLAKQKYEGSVMTTSAFYNTEVIQRAGAAAEDVIFPLPPFDRTSETEPVLGFVQRYLDTYQQAPDTFAAHGYDAMRIAIEVMKVARASDPGEITKGLRFGVSEFMGVTGPILFDDFGDVKHYPKMFIIKDSQVQSFQHYMKAERERIYREVQSLLGSE